jgi:hypothetical protein
MRKLTVESPVMFHLLVPSTVATFTLLFSVGVGISPGPGIAPVNSE